MRKSRFTEEQIVRMLLEADKTSVTEVAKKRERADAVHVAKKYGDVDVADAKKLKTVHYQFETILPRSR
jgi:putative transposase